MMRKTFEVSGKPGDTSVGNFVIWFQLEVTVLAGTVVPLVLCLV